MELNPECVRDILIQTESANYNELLTISKLNDVLPQYSQEQLNYTCLKLDEGEFIQIITVNFRGEYLPQTKGIICLTYKGHEFLANIKADNTWNKTKNIARNIGSNSLDLLKDIAGNVITSLIHSQLQ